MTGTEPLNLRLVPMDEFLASTQPAYSGPGWDAVVQYMTTDPVEAATVDLLRAELSAGNFTTPVVVDAETNTVGNGMHRVVASILHGANTITVADDLPDDEPEHAFEYCFTATHPTMQDYDDLFDLTALVVRSFPVNGTWVEGWLSGRNGQMHVVYGYDGPLTALTDALTAQLTKFDLAMELHAVEPYTYED